jgi:hypothetical protein
MLKLELRDQTDGSEEFPLGSSPKVEARSPLRPSAAPSPAHRGTPGAKIRPREPPTSPDPAERLRSGLPGTGPGRPQALRAFSL